MTTHLGVLDWGIGGVGLLRELDAAAKGLDVTYVSDTGAAPYGRQRPDALAERIGAIVEALAARGCTRVALACNAASTVLPRLGETRIPVEGILAHGIASVPERARRVGVVGGRRTIRSGILRRALARPGRVITSRVAQPLSAHIEAGRIGSHEFHDDLRAIVRPLRGVDALLLACTHYPAAARAFEAELPGTRLLDPARRFASALARASDGAKAACGARQFLTTGAPDEMISAAQLAWGYAIDRAEPLELAGEAR